jgi:hypothetical protein
MSNQNETQTEAANTETKNENASIINNWRGRLDQLLNVKTVDELKEELSKLAQEVQEEISRFDINAHLSPEAKDKLKSFEGTYNELVRGLHKAQKQFDKEFNKTLRILTAKRKEAEKHFSGIKTKVARHRKDLEKAAMKFKGTIKKKVKKTRVIRKTKKKRA